MNSSTLRTLLALAGATAALAIPALSSALPVADYTAPAARDTEPVILTGRDFADWGTRANVTAKAPLTDAPAVGECLANDENCDQHNNYSAPELDTAAQTPASPTAIDQLLAYRWEDGRWEQIPFQVDEMFTRYLDNAASGFAFYSGVDQHTSYAFDREGFRFTSSDPSEPCVATPPPGEPATTADPVRGLDDNDELVFMAGDARAPAPEDTPRPEGIADMRMVRITDPTNPQAELAVYVAKAAEGGPKPKFDRDNGYVRYERDPKADLYEKSESSYDDYGNAARGKVCDEHGNVIADGERRRPRDWATITTDRYRFRYDGRWLMTSLRIKDDGETVFGPDVIDRWKARAFQQDPSSETPCCGYEEEDTNWGGSSTLMGERSGPVRTIRETWGADSGTNVVRRETFYREEIRQKNFLRVHVIPPLDGIYAQWDFNAGRMTRFYNSGMTLTNPGGVAIDGNNDEVFGNLDDPCNRAYDTNDTSDLDQQYRQLYSALPGLCSELLAMENCAPFERWRQQFNEATPSQIPNVPSPCGTFPYHQSIDIPDPTSGELQAGLQWNVTAGPHGTIVDRYQIDDVGEQSAGGTAQSAFAVPYYRDDACFDDGTGTNPGPKVRLRSADEPRTYTAPDGTQQPRACWEPGDSLEEDRRFYQGSIGTHGLHILMIADSDNARQTVPVTEMVAEQRMAVLAGEHGVEAGERYGRGFEKPLVTAVVPAQNPANQPPTASFGYSPDAPHTGRAVSFDSSSEDPDGAVASLDWDLDGDGRYDDATGETSTHTFTTVGDHVVGLRATDSSGATDTETATITVTNPAPTASISHTPAEPRPNQLVTLRASAADENGSITGYAWDLDGDGHFDDATGAQATQTYARPGDFPVAVRVTDNDGADTTARSVVRVGRSRAPR